MFSPTLTFVYKKELTEQQALLQTNRDMTICCVVGIFEGEQMRFKSAMVVQDIRAKKPDQSCQILAFAGVIKAMTSEEIIFVSLFTP